MITGEFPGYCLAMHLRVFPSKDSEVRMNDEGLPQHCHTHPENHTNRIISGQKVSHVQTVEGHCGPVHCLFASCTAGGELVFYGLISVGVKSGLRMGICHVSRQTESQNIQMCMPGYIFSHGWGKRDLCA